MLVEVTNPITNWIFPPRCVACLGERASDPLCAQCASMVTRASKTTQLLQHPKPALFYYEGVIKKLIVAAKFHRSLQHAAALMALVQRELYASNLLNEIANVAPDEVSYVPTHWFRRLERGIDLPQLFALLLARMLSIPMTSLLTRTAYFYRQSLHARKRDRRAGIVGMFSVRSRNTRARLLVVDDIITTGATFDESKKMLKGMGEEIICLAIARTP